MSGRKTGFLAAVTTALLLFGGCGADGTVDEDQARNWYNEMQRNGGVVNDVDPDVVMDTFLYAFRGAAMWRRVLVFEKETLDHLTEAVRYLLIKDYGRKIS